MRAVLGRAVGTALGFLPESSLAALTRGRVVMPLYHLVSDEEAPHVRRLYRHRTPREFAADLDFFLRHFAPLELDDLLHGKVHRRPSFWLSFDDGFREVHDVVAPILKAKGVPATFFLTTGFLDNAELFFRCKASLLGGDALAVRYAERSRLDRMAEDAGIDFGAYLRERRPFLDSSQVATLMNDGFSIGAHSIDHPLFSDIGFDEQVRQARDSHAWLSERFEGVNRVFAFPFNDFGVQPEFPARAGMDAVFGLRGLWQDRHQPRWFQRFSMEEGEATAAERMRHEIARLYL